MKVFCMVALLAVFMEAAAETAQQAIELPTRDGVTQRFLYLPSEKPKATIILFSGGQGNLQVALDGSFKSGGKNFLVRNRRAFAEQGFSVAVVDAPSDRQMGGYANGFRQTPAHVADMKAVIAWLREKGGVPVWLVGTSRGTQSAASVATALTVRDGGPDGLVLVSTILADRAEPAVPAMPLQNLAIPVLVVHHQQDGCRLCPYDQIGGLMQKLASAPKTELITVTGGDNVGDPCEPMAHHGFNGQDAEVVGKIAAWIKGGG
jgi:pimeloyl-ACP methyl ester carboxylesterase